MEMILNYCVQLCEAPGLIVSKGSLIGSLWTIFVDSLSTSVRKVGDLDLGCISTEHLWGCVETDTFED
jgi:hypothetical protein